MPGSGPPPPDVRTVDSALPASATLYASPVAARTRLAVDARLTDALHRLLVASVIDYAIYGVTVDGRVATWNTGAERLKGYVADEILGRSISEFYPPEARGADGVAPRAVALFDEAASAGRAEDEGWRLRRDGTRFWANVIVTPVRDGDGALLGFAKVTRDLTAHRAAELHARDLAAEQAGRAAAEHNEAELRALNERLQDQAVELEAQTEESQSLTEELQETNELLQQTAIEAEQARDAATAANRSKSQFLATMSHELRTPLNAIGGYAELMELEIHGPITAEQRTALMRIQRSQKHLLSLVNEVLHYARLEAAAIQYDMQDVGVAGALASATSLLLPLVQAKNLRLTVDACDPALAVRANAEKLGQVLLNLLANAVKFTPVGGEISITCRTVAALESAVSQPEPATDPTPGGFYGIADEATDAPTDQNAFVEIAVTDTGIGIAPQELDRIFEPFVQIGRALNSPGEGTGLGLAISRELARGMGGELGVRSALGAGSTFAVTLERPTHMRPRSTLGTL